MANNKSSKPSSVVSTKLQSKPSEQLVESSKPPSSPTPKSEQDHAVHTPLLKQNGVKDEEEDIFSPLRESTLHMHVLFYYDLIMIYVLIAPVIG